MTEQRLWKEAESFLYAHSRFGASVGLKRMRCLLDELDRPEEAIPHVVHVGGTNGKGSVVAFLEALLEASGVRVARFTSPHLHHPRERIVRHGRAIPENELAELLLGPVRRAAQATEVRTGQPPTFFELLTAVMYLWSARRGTEWLVQEVGLGGRFDATNLIRRPELVILTQVDLDHEAQLGSTPAAIAADKSRIIKPGRPVVTGAAGESLRVIARYAARKGAPLLQVAAASASPAAPYRFRRRPAPQGGSLLVLETPPAAVRSASTFSGLSRIRGPFLIRLPGAHQAANAALALAAVDQLRRAGILPASDRSESHLQRLDREALLRVRWPGRLEILPGSPTILVDAAHNPAAMEALRHAFAETAPGCTPILVVAALSDKDPRRLFRPWLRTPPVPAAWAVVRVTSHRARSPEALASVLIEEGARTVRPFPQLREGLAWARETARSLKEPAVVVVCGSAYLAGEALRMLEGEGPVAHCGIADKDPQPSGTS